MIDNILYSILVYIFLILTIKKFDIKFISNNMINMKIIDSDLFIRDYIDLKDLNIIDNKY